MGQHQAELFGGAERRNSHEHRQRPPATAKQRSALIGRLQRSPDPEAIPLTVAIVAHERERGPLSRGQCGAVLEYLERGHRSGFVRMLIRRGHVEQGAS